jgi:hypothetical protein
MPDKKDDTPAQASARQQVQAGGPDPQQTRGDASPDRPADPSRHTPGVPAGTGAGRKARAKGDKAYVVLHTIVGWGGLARSPGRRTSARTPTSIT